ncbi:MAG: ATP synthase subunit I [Actinobacteria bacterium]|nr:ATP synthase subunit I [Actinomycetota bacterium]MBV9253502.1 ATP synthase subunit I [Actinomycetota bacterium]MBV9663457.1 ATP synthase subunit I [Actinomycetota bacterium]MBV9934470.1 ATP synthase subunit I [Actinomycetota bacterium]
MEANLTPGTSPEPVEPVERIIAADLVKRGLLLAPLVIVVCALIDGRNGALTAAFALVVVLANFFVSAAVLAWAAQSPTLLMATALSSFLVRMVTLGIAVWLVHDESWVSIKMLAITILVTHLGLLAWETRYVSASLAYPGLKPRRGGA